MLETKIIVATDYPRNNTEVKRNEWVSYKIKKVANFEKMLIKQFGGFTKLEARGNYLGGPDSLENVLVYTVMTDNGDKAKLFAGIIKEDLFQKEVLYTQHETFMEFI